MSDTEHRGPEALNAESISLSMVRVRSLIAHTTTCQEAAISHLTANQVHAQRAAFGTARDARMEFPEGAVGRVLACTLQTRSGQAGWTFARSVEGTPAGPQASWIGLLLGVLLGTLPGGALSRPTRPAKSGVGG
ncbi:MAG: hypothetical protein J7452_07400 [Thermoflexus sp.]|jgi:hypothetical protein|nr:hypothetical protein [Thermoflexus sp.]